MSGEWQIAITVSWLVSLFAVWLGIQALRSQRELLGLIGKVSGLPLGSGLPEVLVQDKHGRMNALSGVVNPGTVLVVVSSTCTECERLFSRLQKVQTPITWLFIDPLVDAESHEVPGELPIFFAQIRRDAVSSLMVPSTPYYYVLDRSGQIADKGLGEPKLQIFG